MRKSSIDKYFKALKELYYRIEILKETNLSLNKFSAENILSQTTPTSLMRLKIIKNNGKNHLNPDLIWITDKPTVKMAENIVKNISDCARTNKKVQNIEIDLKNIAPMALQGILSNKSLNHSDEYLAERAISVSKELIKQLENL